MPALSASSSILNFANSWSNFLKCRSTFQKERKIITQKPQTHTITCHNDKKFEAT